VRFVVPVVPEVISNNIYTCVHVYYVCVHLTGYFAVYGAFEHLGIHSYPKGAKLLSNRMYEASGWLSSLTGGVHSSC